MTPEEALKYIADYRNYAHDDEIRVPNTEYSVHVSDFAWMVLNEMNYEEYKKSLVG